IQVDALVPDDVGWHGGGGDGAAVRAAVGLQQRGLVGRELDRLAAVNVGQRRDLAVQVVEPHEPGDRVVRLGLQRRVGQDPGAGGCLHAGTSLVHLDVAGQQPVVQVVGVDVQVDDDLAGELLG